MNIIIRQNGEPDYRATRRMNREEALEELKENIKSKIVSKLNQINQAFLW